MEIEKIEARKLKKKLRVLERRAEKKADLARRGIVIVFKANPKLPILVLSKTDRKNPKLLHAHDMKRLMSHVIKGKTEDDCWKWIGHRYEYGYGAFCYKNRQMHASRAAWFLFFGELESPKIQVCHKCDNPECCNPKHLFLGTHQDNMTDCKKKGRIKSNPRIYTHCKRGHSLDLTLPHVKWDEKYKRRICMICYREWSRNRRLKLKEACRTEMLSRWTRKDTK